MKKESSPGEFFDDFEQCVWMTAGVVDYKLCDRHFECDDCPLDVGIRKAAEGRHRTGASGPTGAKDRGVMEELTRKVEGYVLPNGLFYHGRHAWMRIEEGGRVRVGLDDFGQRLVGRIYSVGLPEAGRRVGPGQPVWRIIHRAGETELCAPVRGVILEVNDRLAQQPSLVNRDSYGSGAAFLLQPTGLAEDLTNLFYGKQVERWFHAEIEDLHTRLFRLVSMASPVLGQTVQDGGMPIEDLSAVVDPGELQALIDHFLSARRGAGSDLKAQRD
ncbi:MAG: glycine cleavage system protein H [Acidobacteria bacterium]|nr:MAG: glycine cleavage system protein H [Acidobacteriota bacterium]